MSVLWLLLQVLVVSPHFQGFPSNDLWGVQIFHRYHSVPNIFLCYVNLIGKLHTNGLLPLQHLDLLVHLAPQLPPS